MTIERVPATLEEIAASNSNLLIVLSVLLDKFGGGYQIPFEDYEKVLEKYDGRPSIALSMGGGNFDLFLERLPDELRTEVYYVKA